MHQPKCIDVAAVINFDSYCGENSHVTYQTPLRPIINASYNSENISILLLNRQSTENCAQWTDNLYIVAVLSSIKDQRARRAILDTWAQDLNHTRGRIIFVIAISNLNYTLCKTDINEYSPTSNYLHNPTSSSSPQFDACEPIREIVAEVNSAPNNYLFYTSKISDSYTNLSYKMLTLLKWFQTSCNHSVKYLVKSDVDVFWNLDMLYSNLTATLDKPNIIMGNLQQGAAVIRNTSRSWFTYHEEYSKSHYPDYVTGGPGYILSSSAIDLLLEAVIDSKIMWLEDVFITGILRNMSKSSIEIVDNKRLNYCRPSQISYPFNFLAIHYMTPEMVFQIWKTKMNYLQYRLFSQCILLASSS